MCTYVLFDLYSLSLSRKSCCMGSVAFCNTGILVLILRLIVFGKLTIRDLSMVA